MDSPELFEPRSALTKLESQMDALSTSERVRLVEVLRSALEGAGNMRMDEDEQVFQLDCEGALDFRHLHDHFGTRLFNALETWRGSDA